METGPPPGRSARVAVAAAVVLIAVGIVLRLVEFQKAVPLAHDEAALAMNIIDRSWAGLAGPLDHEQGAPYGFLLLLELSSRLFGDGERGLRLVPLLAGILALPCVFVAARRLVGPVGAAIALGIACLSYRAIEYSVELKQYMLDFLVTCGILLLATRRDPWTGWRGAGFAAAGALFVWLSHPAAFVLAGVGVAVGVDALARRDRALLARAAAVSSAWLASWALNYALITRHLAGSAFMNDFWGRAGAFWPFPPRSLDDLIWLRESFFTLFNSPLGSGYVEVGATAFLIGVVALALRSRAALALLLVPLALALVASALEAYPFSGRLLSFAAPALAIVIGAGVAGLIAAPDRLARASGWIFALLLAQPLLVTGVQTARRQPEATGPAQLVAYLAERSGDPAAVRVISNEGAWPVYRYYARDHALSDVPVDALTMFTDDAEIDGAFAGVDEARFWVVHAHYDDLEAMQRRAGRIGRLVDERRSAQMSVHLYERRADRPR